MKVIIIGGVAGGASTATRLRRLDENIEIKIFEKSNYVSFANCGLPYYIGNVIKERQNLILESPATFKNKFNIEVIINSEVISINREKKEITVKDLKKNIEYIENYDKLVISTGAKPFIPNIKGLNKDNSLTLRNIEDMDYIKNYIKKNNPKNVAIIGAGFIGLEIAENLVNIGLNVTLIEKAKQVMTSVDFEIASFIHQELKNNNISLFLETDILEIIKDENNKITIKTSSKEIKTDMLIVSIGVRPLSKLAYECNLKLTDKGYISVNEYLQTSDNDIFALGDVVEINMSVLDKILPVPLAAPANKQGRIVAGNILGKKEYYKGTVGTTIAKIFDLTVSSTGVNEKMLLAEKINYKNVTIIKGNHAGYYPGAEDIVLKILFHPETGKIFGAQGIGKNGVDKRIDIISTAIFSNLSIFELGDIDFAYAPAYNSAKDIVNYAGFMAKNIVFDKMEQVQWNELQGKELLDIRTPEEYELNHIKNARNIPLNELRNRLSELDKEKEYVVYCRIGLRGYNAQRILTSYGFKVFNLNGGTTIYYSATKEQGNKIFFKYNENKIPYKIETNDKAEIILDTCGTQCPGPILKVKNVIQEMKEGETLLVKSNDSSFENDIKAWTQKTGNILLNTIKKKGITSAFIKKGKKNDGFFSKNNFNTFENNSSPSTTFLEKKSTLVIFSGDFDKIFASLIIANGSLAMGNKVSMFFTFWGLNALKKENYKTKHKKNLLEKMFNFMLPKGPKKLPVSKMNFGGIGRKIFDFIMKKKNIETLNSLLSEFTKNGGKIIACTMSMEVMGIKKDELLENIEYGGVAAYMGEADNSNHNLFI